MDIKTVLVVVLCMKCFASDFEDMYINFRKTLGETNLDQTFFSSLENYQVGATPAEQEKYPWIASVVHSRSSDLPYMCTAVCIEERIFITAARCIYGLKVDYTAIIYEHRRLPALAFVVPSDRSKQAFDDIGFVVVEPLQLSKWDTVALYDDMNRTDDNFQWFADLPPRTGYVVVGYATEKGLHRIKSAERLFNLTELEVFVDMKLCTQIFTFHRGTGFHVPCYHSCTFQDFNGKNETKSERCKNYHGVEGAAIITAENKLFGVVTWGAYYPSYELPVGFSVPNSDNFFKDYTCARRIKRDNGILVPKGYYQSLCDRA